MNWAAGMLMRQRPFSYRHFRALRREHRKGRAPDLRRQQARRRRHHQVGGARDRQVGHPCERRGAWSCGHWHVDPFYAHAGEQGGSGEGRSDGAPRPLRGACQRDRLHRVGRSFIHHRPLRLDPGQAGRSSADLISRCRGSNPAASTGQSVSNAYGIGSRSKCRDIAAFRPQATAAFSWSAPRGVAHFWASTPLFDGVVRAGP